MNTSATVRSRTRLRLFIAPLLVVLAVASARRLTAQAVPAPDASVPLRLTLGEAARLAARRSATARIAEFRADEAEARVRQARSALFPQISTSGQQYQRTFNTATFGIRFPSAPGQPPLFDPNGEVPPAVGTVDLRARAVQTLFDPSTLARVRAARAGAEASHADATAASEAAAAIAAATYLRALRAEGQVRARASDSLLAFELRTIARDQLQAGVGVGLDVTRAEAQIANVRAQLIAARGERSRARLELARTLGVSLDQPLLLVDSLDRIDGALPTEAEALSQAHMHRADLRAAEAQLRAAERQIGATRAERLPNVGAFGDDGVIGKDWAHLLNTYTIGLQVSLPIFDGFRREGREQELKAVAREIDVRRRDLEEQASIEVRGALLDLGIAREQVDAARERLRLAEQELAQARDRFRAGVAGNADVVSASIALNTSRTQLVDALSSHWTARVALARAEGMVTTLP